MQMLTKEQAEYVLVAVNKIAAGFVDMALGNAVEIAAKHVKQGQDELKAIGVPME